MSCGARLAPFDIKELREITAYDELELDTLGDQKTSLFLIMSDTDATFNFLISMIYTQLFNLLCEKADDVYGGRLPVHVTCLIDEMANIGQIPNLEKLMATIRNREISACLVLQAKSQLKAIYKDNADTIIGNCDSQIFLGGSEQTTLKDLKLAFSISTSVMIMMVIMMPFFFLAMYEKHGQPLEVFLKHFIQANFVRPKTRPYGISRSHIMEMAKKAGAVYKVGNTALINTEIFEAYLEQFKENPVPLPKYIVDKTKLNK